MNRNGQAYLLIFKCLNKIGGRIEVIFEEMLTGH